MRIRYNHQTGERYFLDEDGYRCDENGRRLAEPGPTVKMHSVMSDIAEFQSPIDGSAISSRSALREHEKRHGIRQCGELKTVADFDNTPAPERVSDRDAPLTVEIQDFKWH